MTLQSVLERFKRIRQRCFSCAAGFHRVRVSEHIHFLPSGKGTVTFWVAACTCCDREFARSAHVEEFEPRGPVAHLGRWPE
jgi:hypothetical protein